MNDPQNNNTPSPPLSDSKPPNSFMDRLKNSRQSSQNNEKTSPEPPAISNKKKFLGRISMENYLNSSPMQFRFNRDFDFKKSFEKFSQFKIDQLFSGKDVPQESSKFKLTKNRCESSNRYAPTQKILEIEERLKQINTYFQNEFNQTKDRLKIPQEFKDGAREKLLFFRRVGRPRVREEPVARNRSAEPEVYEESKSSDTIVRPTLQNNLKTVMSEANLPSVLQNYPQQRKPLKKSAFNEPQAQVNNLEEEEAISVIPAETNNNENSTLQSTTVSNLTQGRQIDESNTHLLETRIEENNSSPSPSRRSNEEAPTNENAQQEAPNNNNDNLNEIVEREASFRLRRAIILFLSVGLFSIFLSLMIENGFSHRTLFMAFYSFLVYYFIEGCKRIHSAEVIHWKKVENIFNILDIASVFFFIVIIDLKHSNIINTTNFAFVVPLLSSTLYYFCSKAPRSVIESQTVTRILFTLQIFLITSKLDGSIQWPWKSVVCLLWIYLGMLVLYFILLAFMMALMVVLSVFGIKLYQNMDKKTQIIGFLWYLSYIGLGPLTFVTLIGLCNAFDEKHDYTILKYCFNFTQYFCVAAILFTRLAQPILVVFLQKFNIDEPEFRIQIGARDSGKLNKLEVEKKNIYLVMLSSTYFLPLRQSFIVKSKQNLKRCKHALVDSKNRIVRRARLKTLSMDRKRGRSEEPVKIESLKRDKEELSKKFDQENVPKAPVAKKAQRKGLTKEKSFDFIEMPVDWDFKSDENIKSPVTLKYKGRCFSEGDKDYIASWAALDEASQNTKHNNAHEKDNLCYICFEKVPNAVIMPCGHGGICYDCSMVFVKSKNQCMECRGPIENVVKIDPNPHVRNIIKGYETTKLVGTQEEPHEHSEFDSIIY